MSDKEIQAHDLTLRKDFLQAVQLYDQILGPNSNNFKTSKERVVACLMGRAECCQELNRHETVLVDCRRVLKLISDGEVSALGIRVRRRLVHSLYKLKRYSEADATCREWQSLMPNNSDVSKLLDRYRTVIQMANGQRANQRISQQRLDEEMMNIDEKLEILANSCPKSNERVKKSSKKGVDNTDERRSTSARKLDFVGNTNSFQKQIDHISSLSLSDTNRDMEKDGDIGEIICSYCCLTFVDRSELRTHCQSEAHQTVIMSDEGRDWRWRPPPRGFTVDSYSLCESHSLGGPCRYGAQCVEAHGAEELAEWRERFEYRRMKLQRASEKELYGKSYTELLLEKWIQAPSPEKIMREKLEGVEETCSSDLVTTVSSKVSKRDWTFVLKTKLLLRAVALLQDAHRNHFTLKQVFPGEPKPNKKGQHGHKIVEATLTSDQEWCVTNLDSKYTDPVTDQSPTLEHRVKVVFSTDIYGTFRQSVVFDFGTEPVLVKHLCVDVVPVTDADKIKEIKKEIILSSEARWDSENAEIVPFSSTLIPIVSSIDNERDRDLFNTYPCPRSNTFTLTQCTVMEKRLTRNNYRSRMHELLYVEEMARYEQVARYNLTTKLRITSSYLLAPSGMATSTAKYSVSGELFALMSLGKDVSEDTSAGRLILNNCTTVFLTSEQPKMHIDSNGKAVRKVYEALIEDKGKNMIYMRLSATTVQELNIKADTDFTAEVQFQLNRLTYCEWHHAIDKIADFRVVFPDTYLEPNIPWTPQRQWSENLDPRLNLKQKEAVVAITTPMHITLPPILIIGPFGTGKTYTLAQAIKQLLMQSDTRILICTHSNSAADLYIKDYLHPWVESGMEDARPLRIYYHKRWVATANQIVQKYCMIETNGNVRNFQKPTLQDVMKHRVIVVTLSISMELANLGLPKGYFTHILLDEAAQAMECEAIMPLALAGERTRIVLAGDHMQLSPELFSAFAKERNLHVSLLERLYDHYPSTFPCKILLCENYRAHEAIIHFTSELFYDQKLISSGKQPRHDKFYPLTFFTTRGEDVQDTNSTAFYNNSEVYEVVERVSELRKKWPSSWGKLDEHSIGIMTPYADQVFRIRSELRKRRMGGISVERVLNVQGKQFRAIFLSTVRTRRTCAGTKPDELDYGFLSNSKLLNTAITRAQSLVAVVGDPVALCSIGRCRKVWERFIDICNLNKSLFGITWSLLRSQLDGVELKKTYVLNPLAPEFIPRAFQSEAYIKSQQHCIGAYNTQSNLQQPSSSSQSVNVRFPVNAGVSTNQIQPFMGAPGPPVYQTPYSVYYYPNQSTQNPQNAFPAIRQPPVNNAAPQQQQNNAPQQNTWTNAFSMLSPKNKNSDPGGPIRMPPTLPTMRSPNNVTMHMNKQMFPLPQPRASPSPPHFVTENYDSLARVNQLYNHHMNQLSAHQPVMPPPSHTKTPSDKEHIQFLQNVHFPERTPVQDALVSRTPEWSLLPPNLTFHDMAVESKARQLEWYRHLLDTQGVEAATKFSEILQHITINKQQPTSSTQQELYMPVNNDISRLEEILNEKVAFNHNLYHNMPNGHGASINMPQVPQDRNWMLNDNKPEVVNYMSKPVILRDVDTSMLLLQQHQQQQTLREERLLQQQISANRTFIPDTSDIPWKFHDSTTHSVPLYRRQAGQHTNALGEMYAGEQHNLLEDKMSVNSNSFSFGHGVTQDNNMHLMNIQQHRQVLNSLTPQQVSQLQQERLQQQINADFAQTLNMNNLGSRKQESVEEMITRQHAQNAATYASVLRNPVKTIDEPERNGDPFAVLRDLGQKNSQQNSGLYHYFQ